MDREAAHELIDRLFDAKEVKLGEDVSTVTFSQPQPETKPERTDSKRAIRTKSTGDRVYLVDDNAKTKAWITTPEILKGLGFETSDVEEVEDSSLLGYQMSPGIYKID